MTLIDIANVYGLMPHNLILTALRKTYTGGYLQVAGIYYSDVRNRFTMKDFTTDRQTVEKGIITGSTMSVVLFSPAMIMLVISVEKNKSTEDSLWIT